MKKNKYTNAENLKIWSLQFEKGEWHRLCRDKDFLNVIMDDIVKASARASEILERTVEPFKID